MAHRAAVYPYSIKAVFKPASGCSPFLLDMIIVIYRNAIENMRILRKPALKRPGMGKRRDWLMGKPGEVT
jgi:hypothetical protein